MWKKLKQKGAETVEYAIVLACIAGLCVMFSDNLKVTMNGLMGNVSSSFTDSDKKDNNGEDPYGKWLQAFLNCSKDAANGVEGYLGAYANKRTEANFKDDNGLIDSASNSKFVNQLEKTLQSSTNLEGCSWAFTGYKDSNGNLCYDVSIYNPNKNGGTKLADQQVGAQIKTDIYKIDTVSGTVSKTQSDVMQKVADRNGYNVIRDLAYK